METGYYWGPRNYGRRRRYCRSACFCNPSFPTTTTTNTASTTEQKAEATPILSGTTSTKTGSSSSTTKTTVARTRYDLPLEEFENFPDRMKQGQAKASFDLKSMVDSPMVFLIDEDEESGDDAQEMKEREEKLEEIRNSFGYSKKPKQEPKALEKTLQERAHQSENELEKEYAEVQRQYKMKKEKLRKEEAEKQPQEEARQKTVQKILTEEQERREKRCKEALRRQAEKERLMMIEWGKQRQVGDIKQAGRRHSTLREEIEERKKESEARKIAELRKKEEEQQKQEAEDILKSIKERKEKLQALEFEALKRRLDKDKENQKREAEREKGIQDQGARMRRYYEELARLQAGLARKMAPAAEPAKAKESKADDTKTDNRPKENKKTSTNDSKVENAQSSLIAKTPAQGAETTATNRTPTSKTPIKIPATEPKHEVLGKEAQGHRCSYPPAAFDYWGDSVIGPEESISKKTKETTTTIKPEALEKAIPILGLSVRDVAKEYEDSMRRRNAAWTEKPKATKETNSKIVYATGTAPIKITDSKSNPKSKPSQTIVDGRPHVTVPTPVIAEDSPTQPMEKPTVLALASNTVATITAAVAAEKPSRSPSPAISPILADACDKPVHQKCENCLRAPITVSDAAAINAEPRSDLKSKPIITSSNVVSQAEGRGTTEGKTGEKETVVPEPSNPQGQHDRGLPANDGAFAPTSIYQENLEKLEEEEEEENKQSENEDDDLEEDEEWFDLDQSTSTIEETESVEAFPVRYFGARSENDSSDSRDTDPDWVQV